jgi:hypothetical protein
MRVHDAMNNSRVTLGVGTPRTGPEKVQKPRVELQVVPRQELELVSRLGGGAFGEVHLVGPGG